MKIKAIFTASDPVKIGVRSSNDLKIAVRNVHKWWMLSQKSVYCFYELCQFIKFQGAGQPWRTQLMPSAFPFEPFIGFCHHLAVNLRESAKIGKPI